MAMVVSSRLVRLNQRGRDTALADRFVVPVGYWIWTGLVRMPDRRHYDMATVHQLVGAPVAFDLRATAAVDVPLGSPNLCFAARVDEFDVAATRERGAEHAADRYSRWCSMVRGRPRADAWAPQAHRIGADGQALRAARHAFLRQPRRRGHTPPQPHTSVPLDPDEPDAFQAGKRTYVTYHRLAATVGGALITGMSQEPMRACNPLLSQRLGYLTAANARLHTLDTTAMFAFRRAEPLTGGTDPGWSRTPGVFARHPVSAPH
ncbi:hypothetical protein ABZS66_22820 [Dactylosporangium sp. NPDC005572]|uniref:hypothetical protein n=1 Tax=Dactylosporangium sp. NPDC005572 TaxID=3156889 RepID=UPI0033A1A72D